MTFPSTSASARPSSAVADAARVRAEELFRSGRYLCTEAVLASLVELMDIGMPPEKAAGLAAAFPDGMGGSGCACGALTGGVLALGLFLSGHCSRRQIRAASGELHGRFTAAFSVACCRVLTRPVKGNKARHTAQCAAITGQAAAMAVAIILDRRPGLAQAGACAAARPGALNGWKRVLGVLPWAR